MLAENFDVPLAEVVQQPRRPLHVGEEERDGAGRELCPEMALKPRADHRGVLVSHPHPWSKSGRDHQFCAPRTSSPFSTLLLRPRSSVDRAAVS